MASAQDYSEHHSYDDDYLLTDAQVAAHRAAAERAGQTLSICRVFKAVEFCHVRVSDDSRVDWKFVVSVDVPLARIVLADSIDRRRGGSAQTVIEGIDEILGTLSGCDVAVVESETGLR